MSKIAKIDSKGLLNVNAPIYDAIRKEKSWELLKNDQDVYIEIRKMHTYTGVVTYINLCVEIVRKAFSFTLLGSFG